MVLWGDKKLQIEKQTAQKLASSPTPGPLPESSSPLSACLFPEQVLSKLCLWNNHSTLFSLVWILSKSKVLVLLASEEARRSQITDVFFPRSVTRVVCDCHL